MHGRNAGEAGPVLGWQRAGPALEIRHACGLTRLDAVAADILRVRFCPDGACRPERDWGIIERLPPVTAETREHDDVLVFAIGAISARVDPDTGAVGFVATDGTVFGEDVAPPSWRDIAMAEIALEHMPESELPAGAARRGLFLDKRLAADAGCFGAGQRTGRLDRRHRRLTHWTVDRASPGHCRGNDNLYQAHPVLLIQRPGHCWGLFMSSTWYSAFDVGYEQPDTLTLFTLGGELDYYLFAGPTPTAVVEQLTRLTGRPALPPLWAMGYHQSRWSYGSDAEVREIATQFRRRRIPLDALHLDIDYMDGYRVFTWDRERFPEPPATVAALHAAGIRAVPIVDPGVKRDLDAGYAVADSGLAQGHFIATPDGEPFVGHVWPGESLFPDFCRADTRRWWGDWHAGLVDAGADGIWCDMNEPSIADRPFDRPGVHDRPIPLATCQGDAGTVTHAEAHNLYGTLMARATAEGLERLRPGRRPWVLTRSGFVGVQRWAASWMGDNSSWWEHLEMSLPQLANMGLSGSPHVGVDIGGFYHHATPELFARWIEVATFYPFMRCHTHRRSRRQEPWAFGPGVEAIAREAIERRYRMLPYLYTLAYRAWRRGEPLLRPLWFDFPDEPRLQQVEDQVMIGPRLMIAPVCQPGRDRRLVELPDACWYDWHSGRAVGSGPLVVDAPPGRLPILVRGGSVLTLGNRRQSTSEPLDELTLDVFPDQAPHSGSWTLVEDDGETTAYRDSAFAETDYRVGPLGDSCVFQIGERHGTHIPPPRTLVIRIHLPAPPLAVVVDGSARDDWTWSASDCAVVLSQPDTGAAHEVMVYPLRRDSDNTKR
jgi:alpha-glucosidase